MDFEHHEDIANIGRLLQTTTYIMTNIELSTMELVAVHESLTLAAKAIQCYINIRVETAVE